MYRWVISIFKMLFFYFSLRRYQHNFNTVTDIEYSHRERSNTAKRLEKMDLERKKAAKVNIKWKHNPAMSLSQQSELFQRKDFRKKTGQPSKRHSLLSEQLEKCPNLPQNPFMEYAKFDGSVRIISPHRLLCRLLNCLVILFIQNLCAGTS